MNHGWNMGLRILWVVVFCTLSLFPVRGMPEGKPEEAISLQISTLKTTYRPGEKSLVSFTVRNQGAAPIYLSRSLICGTWTGYVDFRILNSQGQNVKNGGCAGSEFSIPLDKLKQEVTGSAGWLRLDPGEIYGREGDFEAPVKKGTYRLAAELMPPGFSEQQKQVLASEKVLVLQVRHIAPAVTIVVK
jgi:hypothetical protein